MQLTLTTKIEISEEALQDVLTTACEGGIDYWADGKVQRNDERIVSALLWEREDPQVRFTVDTGSVFIGIQRLHDEITAGTIPAGCEIATQLRDMLFGEGIEYADATLADTIIQMATLGEVRYG